MVIIKHVLYHKSYINSLYSLTVTSLQVDFSDKKINSRLFWDTTDTTSEHDIVL